MPKFLLRGAPAGSAAGFGDRLMIGSCPRSAAPICITCVRCQSTAAAGSSLAETMSGVGRGSPRPYAGRKGRTCQRCTLVDPANARDHGRIRRPRHAQCLGYGSSGPGPSFVALLV